MRLPKADAPSHAKTAPEGASDSFDPADWLPLEQFISAALGGRLKFGLPDGVRACAKLFGHSTSCWKCKRDTAVLLTVEIALSEQFYGLDDICLSIDDLDSLDGTLEQWIRTNLPAKDLRRFGIGAIKERFSRTQNASCMSNGCVHCDSLQGSFYLFHELGWQDQEELGEVVVEVAPGLDEELLRRWCIQRSMAPAKNSSHPQADLPL